MRSFHFYVVYPLPSKYDIWYIYIPTFGWFLIVNVGKYTIVPWILWVCASVKSIDVWVFGKMWKIYQMTENNTLCIFCWQYLFIDYTFVIYFISSYDILYSTMITRTCFRLLTKILTNQRVRRGLPPKSHFEGSGAEDFFYGELTVIGGKSRWSLLMINGVSQYGDWLILGNIVIDELWLVLIHRVVRAG